MAVRWEDAHAVLLTPVFAPGALRRRAFAGDGELCPLPSTAVAAIPPIPAGEARVWFYRDGGPYDGRGTPYLRMNEAIVGVSEPGGALYRDVWRRASTTSRWTATGATLISPVGLPLPGQQAYFKIVSLRNWVAGGGPRDDFQRDTFYVWDIPPEIAQGDVARSQFYGGS